MTGARHIENAIFAFCKFGLSSFVFILSLNLISCNYILKNNNISNDSILFLDSLSSDSILLKCDFDFAYRWSSLRNKCIIAKNEGFRLSPIELERESEKRDSAVFFIFNEDKTKAEIFLPNTQEGLVLELQDSVYMSDKWILDTEKTMSLKYDGNLLYKASNAADIENININND